MRNDEVETVRRHLLVEFGYERVQRNRVIDYKILSDIVPKLSFLTELSETNHLI